MKPEEHTAECGGQPAGCGCICGATPAKKPVGLRLVWSKSEPKKLEIPMLSRQDYELLYGRRIK